jgi:hypothetical protein
MHYLVERLSFGPSHAARNRYDGAVGLARASRGSQVV